MFCFSTDHAPFVGGKIVLATLNAAEQLLLTVVAWLSLRPAETTLVTLLRIWDELKGADLTRNPHRHILPEMVRIRTA